jgi:hypothetical protein
MRILVEIDHEDSIMYTHGEWNFVVLLQASFTQT